MANYPFDAAVDVCGGNMWVWANTITPENQGCSLIKAGDGYFPIPQHWRDHLAVVTRQRSRVQIRGLSEDASDAVAELSASRKRVLLDTTHKNIISELEDLPYSTFWVDDHNLLQTHTCALSEVFNGFAKRGNPLKGAFSTISEGQSDDPGKPNCFCFPCPDGAFKVIRFGDGTNEHPTWQTDARGRTFCYFNQPLNLSVAANLYNGEEVATGGYTFPTADAACKAVSQVGGVLSIPEPLVGKPVTLRPHKDGRTIVTIKGKTDQTVIGFAEVRGGYEKILNVPFSTEKGSSDDESLQVDSLGDAVRLLVDTETHEIGWCYKDPDKSWSYYCKDNIRSLCKSQGLDKSEAEVLLGTSVQNSWTLENKPFQPEYPGDRQWNRDAAQLAIVPAPYSDDLHTLYPHWLKVLEHCGEELNAALAKDKWAKAVGITTGRDYLFLWVASWIRRTEYLLPYLFFHGPQNSGKSIFHEALEILLKNKVGKVAADNSLTSPSNFNGELSNAILCTIEETDLSRDKHKAYRHLKDWTTCATIAIHDKGRRQYQQKNTTHWVHCANSLSHCPIFPGDTRVIAMFVEALKDEIPKHLLLAKLTSEAPFFLAALLNAVLPEPTGRLGLPVISTASKDLAEKSNRSELEVFLEEHCFQVPGCSILVADFLEEFKKSCSGGSTKSRSADSYVVQDLQQKLPIGKMNSGKLYIGNLSFTPSTEKLGFKYVCVDGSLEKETL
jgi:hypothetical protein